MEDKEREIGYCPIEGIQVSICANIASLWM
jgi:hypothetical protein